MSTQRYLVTARKYRPKLFNEVVAQEHVTDTLKNAIRLDRLGHAYLFSGPRGVGKTTAARILAKAINCTTPREDRVDQAEPCRQCESCRSFEEGRSLSIIEIDAASNNRVDDVRELRETVRIPPQGSLRKVYIIDEVHMLSAAAFNALLKTLEEPPPYALFIFATTEPNKVLPTILSRCQRFDFRRIPVEHIVEHLREISTAEGVTADDASLLLIARKGDGALRDALSAFDQAVSLCGMNLEYAELARALRVVEVDLYFRLTDAIISGDAAAVLRLVHEVVRGGYDLQEFLAGVAEHFRNILVAQTSADPALIEATDETRARFSDVAGQLGEADILRMLTVADETEQALRFSVQPRLKLELALLKMVALPRASDLRALIRKIEALERQGATMKTDAGNDAVEAGSRNRAARPDDARPSRAPTALPRSADSEDRLPTTPRADSTPRPANIHPLPNVPTREKPVESAEETTQSPERKGPPIVPGIFDAPALTRRGEKSKRSSDEDGPSGRAMFAGSGALATAPDAPPDVAADPMPAPGVDPEEWQAAVRAVHVDRIHVGALLQHCKPADYRRETLTLAVPDDFHRRMLGSQDEYLARRLNEGLSLDIAAVRFVVREDLLAPQQTETADQIDPLEYFNRKREENPVVRAIFEQFGGELVW